MGSKLTFSYLVFCRWGLPKVWSRFATKNTSTVPKNIKVSLTCALLFSSAVNNGVITCHIDSIDLIWCRSVGRPTDPKSNCCNKPKFSKNSSFSKTVTYCLSACRRDLQVPSLSRRDLRRCLPRWLTQPALACTSCRGIERAFVQLRSVFGAANSEDEADKRCEVDAAVWQTCAQTRCFLARSAYAFLFGKSPIKFSSILSVSCNVLRLATESFFVFLDPLLPFEICDGPRKLRERCCYVGIRKDSKRQRD